MSFFGHFCKITWNPIPNPLIATKLEALKCKLNTSIICGTGRARKTPANRIPHPIPSFHSSFVNLTSYSSSYSPSPPRATLSKAGDRESVLKRNQLPAAARPCSPLVVCVTSFLYKLTKAADTYGNSITHAINKLCSKNYILPWHEECCKHEIET